MPLPKSPSPEDQARLAEVARLMAEARENIEKAAALLLTPAGVVVGNTHDVAEAYLAEWERLTRWLDSRPVTAFHYVCPSEWTGGSLSDPGPGTQSVSRWPSSFGTPSPSACDAHP